MLGESQQLCDRFSATLLQVNRVTTAGGEAEELGLEGAQLFCEKRVLVKNPGELQAPQKGFDEPNHRRE